MGIRQLKLHSYLKQNFKMINFNNRDIRYSYILFVMLDNHLSRSIQSKFFRLPYVWNTLSRITNYDLSEGRFNVFCVFYYLRAGEVFFVELFLSIFLTFYEFERLNFSVELFIMFQSLLTLPRICYKLFRIIFIVFLKFL